MLKAYQKRRNFKKTPEPKGRVAKPKKKKHLFVIQKHRATHLHYDFRLEVDGVLKSWAVPKGISKQTKDKRLAVQTEDHPLSYAKFEGTIPEGEYGAGTVEIWDSGTYQSLKEMTMKGALRKGRVEIYLTGKRIKGAYALIRFKGKNWLLIRMKKKPQQPE